MTRLVRDFLRRTRGRFCIDCAAAKLGLPGLEVRVAFGELGNELASLDGRFQVTEGVCAACGQIETTATFVPQRVTTAAPVECAWCHEPITGGVGVAVLSTDGHALKVHMHCLRKFRASRFDVN